MARKKKEEQIEIKEPVKAPVKDPIRDFGTGWTGKNNKIQFKLREGKRNE